MWHKLKIRHQSDLPRQLVSYLAMCIPENNEGSGDGDPHALTALQIYSLLRCGEPHFSLPATNHTVMCPVRTH